MAESQFYVADEQVRELDDVIATGDIELVCTYDEQLADTFIVDDLGEISSSAV